MMSSCQKKYHSIYLKQKEKFDARVIEWIDTKEEIIITTPNTNPFLKHEFSRIKIRRYKSGKLRILYAISTECPDPDLFDPPPSNDIKEVIFLYVDLRSDNTYKEASKLLKRGKFL